MPPVFFSGDSPGLLAGGVIPLPYKRADVPIPNGNECCRQAYQYTAGNFVYFVVCFLEKND